MTNGERGGMIFLISGLWFASGILTAAGLAHRLDFGNWGAAPGSNYAGMFALGIVAFISALGGTVATLVGVMRQ